jgi:hypothetical protein
MPSVEQQHPADCVQQPNIGLAIGLHDVQCATWGPEAANNAGKTQSTNTLDAFGHLTIDLNGQGDSFREWCAKPFKDFQAPVGLKDAETALEQSKGSINDHVLGVEVGTVKAVYGIGNSVVGIANAIVSPPARLGNWLATTIKEPTTSISDSAKFGDDVGKTLVTGVKLFHAVDNYAEKVKQEQSKGNYTKPLVDANNGLHMLADKFKNLTPGQKTEAVTEQVVSFGTPIAGGKVLAAAPEAFASLMEKMDAFKGKSDAVRLHFGIEDTLVAREKIHAEREINDATAPHLGGDDHLAGARNSRFQYKEFDKVRSLDVPIQCHNNACVAAIGEMLSEGKIEQRTLVELLEQNKLPEKRGQETDLSLKALAKELGQDWTFESISKVIDIEPLFQELLARGHSFGVTFKAYRVDAHAVVVDGIDKAGRVLVRDPGDGTMYKMAKKDFMDHWTGLAVAKKGS